MQGIKYSVDIVMCIDVTGSMGSLIDTVKSSALAFYEDLTKTMSKKDKAIDTLRVKVVAFRDYYSDGEKSMMISPFFTLPQDKEKFAHFVNLLVADGGGDEPETGLEALALAIKSDWTTSANKRRQVIVVWTDTSAHPLDKNADSKPSGYPTDLPKTFDELTDWWEGQGYMSSAAKRLIIYAPDAYPWTDIANYWSNVVHYPSKAGQGLSELDYQTILDVISSSI
jgi:hypothetical protein